jgi:hypothetical protein
MATSNGNYIDELEKKSGHFLDRTPCLIEACAEVDRLRNDLADLQQDFRKLASDKGDVEAKLARVSSAQKIQKELLIRSEARAAELERRLGELPVVKSMSLGEARLRHTVAELERRMGESAKDTERLDWYANCTMAEAQSVRDHTAAFGHLFQHTADLFRAGIDRVRTSDIANLTQYTRVKLLNAEARDHSMQARSAQGGAGV